MISGEKPLTLSGDPSFAEVLDRTCDRLWDRKVRYSVRRIQELEDYLNVLERELDALALPGDRGRTG
jgi:hypothetical protein